MFHDIPSLFFCRMLYFFLLLFLSFAPYYILSVILSVIEAEDVKRQRPYTSKMRRIKWSCIAWNHVVRWYSLRIFLYLDVEERDYCFACDQTGEKVDRWIKEYMHATGIKAYFCESR